MKTKYILLGFLHFVPVVCITARSLNTEDYSTWRFVILVTININNCEGFSAFGFTSVDTCARDITRCAWFINGHAGWLVFILTIRLLWRAKSKANRNRLQSQQFKDDMYHGECYHYHPVCYCTINYPSALLMENKIY